MIMHIDMDAFFASVEQMDVPALRGRPVIVGNGARGVASTCSYEARVFGIHSAMPLFSARILCPEGIFLPCRMSRYKEVSGDIFKILQAYSPCIEKASIDEWYLDITGTTRLFGPPEVLARIIQQKILQSSGLPCSIGVAPVKFLAKIASDWRKPRGVTVIAKEGVGHFLRKVPIARIPGVGQKSMPFFKTLGITYAAEILNFSKEFWMQRLGKRGEELYTRAEGKDAAGVVASSRRKSCSAENTLTKDTRDMQLLTTWLRSQSRDVGMQLRSRGLYGRTITLKLKFDDFTSLTRSRTLTAAGNSTSVIYEAASSLLHQIPLVRNVRLIGVGVSHFSEKTQELPFLESRKEKKLHYLEAAMDAISKKFGSGSARPASLLELEKTRAD